MNDALDHYRTKAGESSYTSHKMNANPDDTDATLKFKPGNIFPLAAWFINQHGLSYLKKYLYPEVVIAYALQTTRYSFDESIMTGKNGGEPLNAQRSHAYFRLLNDAESRKNVSLVAIVLYGEDGTQQSDSTLDEEAKSKGIPTPHEIAKCYDLDKAKIFCAKQQSVPTTPTERPKQHHGRFIVLDFLSMAASAEAAKLMRDAGLHSKTLFDFSQLPNACGYLAAGWAVMLRALGLDFTNLDMATAAALNTVQFIAGQNAKININTAPAVWLTDDQILALASADNPDGHNTAPSWLMGPAPINYFRTTFHNTLLRRADHGRVHIMVVNTEAQYTLQDAASGMHWFLAAWYIEPESD